MKAESVTNIVWRRGWQQTRASPPKTSQWGGEWEGVEERSKRGMRGWGCEWDTPLHQGGVGGRGGKGTSVRFTLPSLYSLV